MLDFRALQQETTEDEKERRLSINRKRKESCFLVILKHALLAQPAHDVVWTLYGRCNDVVTTLL